MSKLFIPAAFILLSGLATISSVSQHLFLLQLAWAGIGLFFVALSFRSDAYAMLNSKWIAWGLYGLSILLLVIAYLTAPVIRNTRSWLVLGSLSFQPVELVKIGLILVYARYFSREHLSIARLKTIINSFLIFALPAALTLMQPDLGSTSILFGIWFGFLLISGLPRRRIIAALILFIIVGVLGWQFALKGYQRERIKGVFYPERNALSINYSVIQSKIAIGSAGFWGRGYNQGPQTQLGFLTEPANDFILAALIEEWGLMGGFLVIGAFLSLIFGILKTGLAANQNFEKFICLGTAVVLGLHFLLNAGSTVGLFPVVGVTFPFLSYGGSNLLASFFLLAMVNTISRRA